MPSRIGDYLNSETTQVLWRLSFSFSRKMTSNSLKLMKTRPSLTKTTLTEV